MIAIGRSEASSVIGVIGLAQKRPSAVAHADAETPRAGP